MSDIQIQQFLDGADRIRSEKSFQFVGSDREFTPWLSNTALLELLREEIKSLRKQLDRINTAMQECDYDEVNRLLAITTGGKDD